MRVTITGAREAARPLRLTAIIIGRSRQPLDGARCWCPRIGRSISAIAYHQRNQRRSHTPPIPSFDPDFSTSMSQKWQYRRLENKGTKHLSPRYEACRSLQLTPRLIWIKCEWVRVPRHPLLHLGGVVLATGSYGCCVFDRMGERNAWGITWTGEGVERRAVVMRIAPLRPRGKRLGGVPSLGMMRKVWRGLELRNSSFHARRTIRGQIVML
jgi:hypothetical protein